METKQEAYERLMSDYMDEYGRVTLYPTSMRNTETGEYMSENQNLWSGEASALLDMSGLLTPEYIEKANAGFDSVTIEPGLISRRPFPHWLDPTHHNVSWDEYNGMMYHSIAVGDQKRPAEAIAYGRANGWSYVDHFHKMGLKERLTWYFRGLRQPRDTFFFKIAAGEKPSLFEQAFSAVSLIMTGNDIKGQASGPVMAWFKIKSLEKVGYRGKLWDYAVKKFEAKLKKVYETEDYAEKIVSIYFHADHPFNTLIK